MAQDGKLPGLQASARQASTSKIRSVATEEHHERLSTHDVELAAYEAVLVEPRSRLVELRERISLAIVQDRDPASSRVRNAGVEVTHAHSWRENIGQRGGVFATVVDRLTAVKAWRTPTHWIAYPRAVFG